MLLQVCNPYHHSPETCPLKEIFNGIEPAFYNIISDKQENNVIIRFVFYQCCFDWIMGCGFRKERIYAFLVGSKYVRTHTYIHIYSNIKVEARRQYI